VLPGVAHAVRPVQVRGVLEPTVDRLRVTPPGTGLLEVRIARSDRPHALGPVELSGGVLVVDVRPHQGVVPPQSARIARSTTVAIAASPAGLGCRPAAGGNGVSGSIHRAASGWQRSWPTVAVHSST